VRAASDAATIATARGTYLANTLRDDLNSGIRVNYFFQALPVQRHRDPGRAARCDDRPFGSRQDHTVDAD